jgi:hypothetical protein
VTNPGLIGHSVSFLFSLLFLFSSSFSFLFARTCKGNPGVRSTRGLQKADEFTEGKCLPRHSAEQSRHWRERQTNGLLHPLEAALIVPLDSLNIPYTH